MLGMRQQCPKVSQTSRQHERDTYGQEEEADLFDAYISVARALHFEDLRVFQSSIVVKGMAVVVVSACIGASTSM